MPGCRSFLGSKKRFRVFAASDSGSTLASPKSVESTQTRSANDCTLVQSKRRRLASRSRQSANLCVSSSVIRLAQPCSHSMAPAANGRPHFQQVFMFPPSLIIPRLDSYLFLKIQFHGGRLREHARQFHGDG